MSELLPPNASDLQQALADVFEQLLTQPAPLRQLWNVDTCPVVLLPWLAWAMGVKTWNSRWTESVKRSRIRHAVSIHKKQGTVASVKEVVQSFGGNLLLKEWWQMTPLATPHTFNVTLTINNDLPQDQVYLEAVIAGIDAAKPARSHFTFTVAQQLQAPLAIASVARPINYTRLNLQEG